MCTAPTVHGALTQLCRYFALGTSLATWKIEDDRGAPAVIRFRHAIADALRVELHGAGRTDAAVWQSAAAFDAFKADEAKQAQIRRVIAP